MLHKLHATRTRTPEVQQQGCSAECLMTQRELRKSRPPAVPRCAPSLWSPTGHGPPRPATQTSPGIKSLGCIQIPPVPQPSLASLTISMYLAGHSYCSVQQVPLRGSKEEAALPATWGLGTSVPLFIHKTLIGQLSLFCIPYTRLGKQSQGATVQPKRAPSPGRRRGRSGRQR